MKKDKMTADERFEHFLKTGKLPEMPIKISNEEMTALLKNEISTIHFRDFWSAVTKAKNNPWREFNPAQLKVIAANTPDFNKKYIKLATKYILSYPERCIALIESKDYQKAVFEDHNPEKIYLMKLIVIIYLNLNLFPEKSLDTKDERNKRLIQFLATQDDFLRDLEKKINDIPQKSTSKSQFSVLEWATIFYYADSVKSLPEANYKKTRMEQFMSKHGITTSFLNFKTKYYNAQNRINKENDYPISKLKLILPFIKENYNRAVTRVENDIEILEEYNTD